MLAERRELAGELAGLVQVVGVQEGDERTARLTKTEIAAAARVAMTGLASVEPSSISSNSQSASLCASTLAIASAR
jgi:hypothetical protein